MARVARVRFGVGGIGTGEDGRGEDGVGYGCVCGEGFGAFGDDPVFPFA